jgi:hypothetical protein
LARLRESTALIRHASRLSPKTKVTVCNACAARAGRTGSDIVDIALASHVHAMDTAPKVK